MYPHHVFDLEPAGTFGMYPICYRWVSSRYFQPEPAMYSRCFHWFPGPLAPSVSLLSFVTKYLLSLPLRLLPLLCLVVPQCPHPLTQELPTSPHPHPRPTNSTSSSMPSNSSVIATTSKMENQSNGLFDMPVLRGDCGRTSLTTTGQSSQSLGGLLPSSLLFLVERINVATRIWRSLSRTLSIMPVWILTTMEPTIERSPPMPDTLSTRIVYRITRSDYLI